jgi:predicted site-specific integrase-resolvase
MSPSTEPQATLAANAPKQKQRLLLKAREVCELLGGIHPRTLSRMEKSGLIRNVKLLRHRMYLPEDVTKLVDSLRSWERRAA